eukprot:TRINITY_DN41203_c0_g2_i1.p1 TRINITY_DN41203_c0_g2~~TRINITY_DN41203_c0_g2_i1.p1  ORF type:complete len:777 (-),score=158.17 TRINITY_DN41203_c0_g2_i1:194-2524(-)
MMLAIERARCRVLLKGCGASAAWQRQALRHKGGKRGQFTRLLWRPQFPTDLPPALRQNAEVAKYAAPEVSPHKKVWTIYATSKLHEVALDLCAKGATQEMAANVIYHALITVDCKDPSEARRRSEKFRSDLFTTCSNLFEVHHVHQGAENIFGVLNEATIREISPDMRKSRRAAVQEIVLETVEEWVMAHGDSFGRVNASNLFQVVGPAAFFDLVPKLHLNINALRGEDLEVLFHHLVFETRDMFGTMRVALSLMRGVNSIHEEFRGKANDFPCSWTLRRVLAEIERRRSEEALRFFLSHLEPVELLREAIRALKERDYDTGLITNHWSFITTARIEAEARVPPTALLGPLPGEEVLAGEDASFFPKLRRERVEKPMHVPRIDEFHESWRPQRLFITDGELRPFSIRPHRPVPLSGLAPASTLRDSAWPQLAFDPSEALAADQGHQASSASSSRASNAYDVITSAAAGNDMDALVLFGGDAVVSGDDGRNLRPSTKGGLPSPTAGLPLDAIHFVDSTQGLSHVLTFLQQAPPEFVGIDLEWTEPHAVSLLQIATPHRAFVVDCVHRTELFMAVLHCLVDWLMKREKITKLFFGFPNDLLRLNMLFEPQGKTFGSGDHIASILDLYSQRVRRVSRLVPRDEDTPLGREALLGDALRQGDYAEVEELSQKPLVYPPREQMSEQVFLLGGHHSLASMVERYLGEGLSKEFRRSNWNFRPLSAAQVIYAATDAHVLLRLEAAMREEGVLPQRIFGCGPRRAYLQPKWWDDADGETPLLPP